MQFFCRKEKNIALFADGSVYEFVIAPSDTDSKDFVVTNVKHIASDVRMLVYDYYVVVFGILHFDNKFLVAFKSDGELYDLTQTIQEKAAEFGIEYNTNSVVHSINIQINSIIITFDSYICFIVKTCLSFGINFRKLNSNIEIVRSWGRLIVIKTSDNGLYLLAINPYNSIYRFKLYELHKLCHWIDGPNTISDARMVGDIVDILVFGTHIVFVMTDCSIYTFLEKNEILCDTDLYSIKQIIFQKLRMPNDLSYRKIVKCQCSAIFHMEDMSLWFLDIVDDATPILLQLPIGATDDILAIRDYYLQDITVYILFPNGEIKLCTFMLYRGRLFIDSLGEINDMANYSIQYTSTARVGSGLCPLLMTDKGVFVSDGRECHKIDFFDNKPLFVPRKHSIKNARSIIRD